MTITGYAPKIEISPDRGQTWIELGADIILGFGMGIRNVVAGTEWRDRDYVPRSPRRAARRAHRRRMKRRA